MKFSFDSEGYRNNLANELREKRATDKEGARQRLEEERATLQYKVSEDIKRVKQKIKEKREKKGLETFPFIPNPEKTTLEEVRLEGSDGIEHLLEVQTIDISDQIPEEVKLIYDIFRLFTLEQKLAHLDINSGILNHAPVVYQSQDGKIAGQRRQVADFTNAKGENAEVGFTEYIRLKLNDDDLELLANDEMAFYSNKESSPENDERAGELLEATEKEAFEITDLMNKKFNRFYELVTNGAISNDNYFSHVMGANEEGYFIKLKNDYPERHADLKNQYPHESDKEIVTEKPIEVGLASSDYLWVNAGGTAYNRLFKPIILINSYSRRFKAELNGFGFYEGSSSKFDEYLKKLQETNTHDTNGHSQELMAALYCAQGRTETGIKLKFKKETPWLLIADQIVDPYHGRLIKVREKLPTEDTVTAPSPE